MSEIKIDPKQGIKLKGADKTARIPIKVVPLEENQKARMDTRQAAHGQEIF